MFNFNHYVPVLHWKRAEYGALQNIMSRHQSAITPLIQIVQIPVDLDSGDPKKTLEQHIDPNIDKLVNIWGLSAPFFLDPEDVAAEMSAAGLDGAEYVFLEAGNRKLHFVPVTGLFRTQHEITAAVKHSHNGICLRFTMDDLARPSIASDILAFVEAYKLDPVKIDIVLDMESVYGQKTIAVASTMNFIVGIIPNHGQWRTFSIVASGFPEHMGVVQTFGTHRIERVEWLAWQLLHAQRSKLPRMPSFGDYGIQHPSGVEGYDPRYMSTSSAIRYTTDTEWFFIKGQSNKYQKSSTQLPHLAKALIGSNFFYGGSHCHGCNNAISCAAGQAGFGSLEAWRKIGTAHHLSVVSFQLASVSFP